MSEFKTNSQFKEDDHFKKCCESVGIEVTARQASKFRAVRGRAFAEGSQLVKASEKKKEIGGDNRPDIQEKVYEEK